jgi:hypothetical protein
MATHAEPERPAPEDEPREPGTLPDEEPGVTPPEPGTLPEDPDFDAPDPERM